MLRRFIHSAAAVLSGHVIARLGSLLLLPLFLRYWSAGPYGEYLALTAAASYLAALDFGLHMAAVTRLTQAYARGDIREYRSCQHSALFLHLALAAGATLVVLAAALLLPFTPWLGLKEITTPTARVVLILAAMYVSWSMPSRLVTSLYQTTGNLARSQWISNAQQIVYVGITAGLLASGAGMIAIATVQVCMLAATTGFVLLDTRRKFVAIWPGISSASLAVIRSLLHPSALFMLLLVANFLTMQGAVLLVAARLGGVAVAVFSVTRTMVNLVREGLYSLQVALWPDLARMEAVGEKANLRDVHRIVVALSSALAIAVCAALWFEGADVISFWLRGRLQPSLTLLRVLLVYAALQAPWVASSSIATATNRHRRYAVAYFASSLLFLGVAGSLIPRFGLPAVGLGLLIGEALACYHPVIRNTCQIIGEAYGRFAARLWAGFALVAGLAFGVAWAVHELYAGPMVGRWLIVGVCTLAVSTTAAGLIWLTPFDRVRIFNRLAPVVPWSSARASAAQVGQ